MKSRNIAMMFILLAGLMVTGTVVWGQISEQDARKLITALRPYQVLSGQVSSKDFEVIYILDNESRRLAVLKFDMATTSLIPVGGRQLAKDFGTPESGGYSMVSTQLSGQQGLLYVTDFAAHKAIAYRVDLINNQVTPLLPVDLKQLFGN